MTRVGVQPYCLPGCDGKRECNPTLYPGRDGERRERSVAVTPRGSVSSVSSLSSNSSIVTRHKFRKRGSGIRTAGHLKKIFVAKGVSLSVRALCFDSAMNTINQ